MSVATEKLTRGRFRDLYGDHKPNYELIDGVPEQKASGSKRHARLQVILSQMLEELGFRRGHRIDARHQRDVGPGPGCRRHPRPGNRRDLPELASPPW